MRNIGVCGLLAAIGLMAAAGDAFAVTVDCTMNAGALANAFTSGGTAGTDYKITGPCNGNFTITQDNITIEAALGTQTISGPVAISGASNIALLSLIINPGFGAAVLIVGPASVAIGDCTIEHASAGVGITGPARVTIITSTIQNVGNSGNGGGVTASGPSLVVLTATTIQMNNGVGIDADEGSMIEVLGGSSISQSSGSTVGPAIRVRHSSSVAVRSQGSSVTVTGPDNAPTIVADQNSSVFIDPGSTITTSSASTAGPAIAALQSSSVTVLGATVTGPSANHTILVAQGSNAILNGSTVTAATPFSGKNPLAVITATGSSSVALAGNNTITNTAPIVMFLPAPAAVIVSDGSSFIDVNGTLFGFTAGLDTINGDGRIVTQSVIELASASGVGVDWTGNISAFAASSFRADGGDVTVNGTLTLKQAANGYFNQQNGTTNNITHVVCRSTTDHVTNPTFVTPNITIGAPPGCALF